MARTATSAVAKALDLIEAVASSDHPLRLSELAGRVGMHRATAYRVLVDLVRRGWVMRADDAYLLGTAVLVLSRSAAASSMIALCQPIQVDLATRTAMMTNLQVLEPDGSRILDVIRPPRYALTGELLPMHRFAGPLALVAALDERMAARYLALAEQDGHPLDGPEWLRADLEATRKRGYAVVRRRAQDVIASGKPGSAGRRRATSVHADRGRIGLRVRRRHPADDRRSRARPSGHGGRGTAGPPPARSGRRCRGPNTSADSPTRTETT